MIEYFPDAGVRTGYNLFYEFFDGTPRAVDGRVEVAPDPGLGIALNGDAIDRYAASGVVLTPRGRQEFSDVTLSAMLPGDLLGAKSTRDRVAS
jgi:hypothetical protein